MAKKIFIFAIIFFIGAVGLGWYFIFYNKTTDNTPVNSLDSSNYAPFGGTSGTTTPQDNVPVVSQNDNQNIFLAGTAGKLMRITTLPTAGSAIWGMGATTTVQFLERATGHIYEADLGTGKIVRLSNTTIPKVYEAYFTTKGGNIILRYLADDETTINTFVGKVKTATSTQVGEFQGKYIDQNIDHLALSPKKDKMFYLTNGRTGGFGYTANTDGSKKSLVFSSPIGEWLGEWPTENTIVLTNKPSYDFGGNIYSLSTKTGLLSKVIGSTNGLTGIFDSSFGEVVYSNSVNFLTAFNIKTGSEQSLDVRTLSEKCVWAKKEKNTIYCGVPNDSLGGSMPDSWYQGLFSFNDSIYKVDTISGKSTLLIDLQKDYKFDIDATNLQLSDDEKTLIFTNKKDYTVWGLKL